MHLNPFSRLSMRRLGLPLLLGIMLSSLLIVTSGAAPQAPQEPETVVRCKPAFTQVEPGEQFTIDIYVQDVQNLSGADVQMSYDPDALLAVDQNPNKAGIQMQLLDVFLYPDFVLRDNIDPVKKKIWYAAVQINSPGNPRDPAEGSGSLAAITFDTVREGDFDLSITSAELSTPDGFAMPYTTGECAVRVGDGLPPSQAIHLPIIISP